MGHVGRLIDFGAISTDIHTPKCKIFSVASNLMEFSAARFAYRTYSSGLVLTIQICGCLPRLLFPPTLPCRAVGWQSSVVHPRYMTEPRESSFPDLIYHRFLH